MQNLADGVGSCRSRNLHRPLDSQKTMTISVPVIRHKNAKAWPKHPSGAAAIYVGYQDALTMHFQDREAYTCAYSLPSVKRRLAGDAYDHVEGGVVMQLLLIDLDAPAHIKTDEWAIETKMLIQELFAKHPGGFCSASKGGFRVYYPLKTPFVIANIDDKLAWTRYYVRVLEYLQSEFALDGDPKCKDWCRLQRLPHDTRDGVLQLLDTFGDPTGGYGWELPNDVVKHRSEETPAAKSQPAKKAQPSKGVGGGTIPISKKLIKLVMKKLPEFAPTKVQLQLVCDGMSWSVSGDRDSSAMQMTWAIAKMSTQFDPSSLDMLFEESVTRIKVDDPEFTIDIGDMYRRACVKIDHDRSMTLADAPEIKQSDKAIYNSDPEHVQHAQVSKALAKHQELYSQAGEIVAVQDEVIIPISVNLMPSLISSSVTYIGAKGSSIAVPQHVCKSVHADRQRIGWRKLLGTKESAAMRPDGTVHSEAGYDPMTSVYLTNPVGKFERMELGDAVETLVEPFADFLFNDGGLAGCIACILTLLARDLLHDMSGSVPAFVFTAPDSGSGKTTLAEICQIISGVSEPGSMAYVSNSAEMEKRFQAHAMGGDACMYIDNWQTGAVVGGPMLDSMVTSKKTVKVRDFGKLRNMERQWRSTILITGNQLEVRGDFRRRVVYISVQRQDPDYKFAIRELRTHVLANRVRYLAAATSILSHSMSEGPDYTITLPSFETWCTLVGAAVWRAGFGDPTEGRKVLDEENEDECFLEDEVQLLAELWPSSDSKAEFLTKELLEIPEAPEIFEALYRHFNPRGRPYPEENIAVRDVAWVMAKLNRSKQFVRVGVFTGRSGAQRRRYWSFKPAVSKTVLDEMAERATLRGENNHD